MTTAHLGSMLVQFNSLISNRLCQVTSHLCLNQSRSYIKDPKRPRPGKVFGEVETKIPIYYDYFHGERKTDPDAVVRFYRLHWGGWIRTKGGRRKKLWQRPWEYHWWNRQHIMCSDDQCDALEKMITPEYKKARHFVDDPYRPYHKRHEIDVLPRGKERSETHYLKMLWD